MTLLLREALLKFDGRSTAILSETAHKFSSKDSYHGDLISLFDDESTIIADGATWLLKHDLEAGGQMDKANVTALVEGVGKLTSWAACLHMCQLVRFLAFSQSQAITLGSWISGLLNHNRPFVRAWSLNALVYLSREYSILLDEAKSALEQAEGDEAASVKARARNLRKEG